MSDSTRSSVTLTTTLAVVGGGVCALLVVWRAGRKNDENKRYTPLAPTGFWAAAQKMGGSQAPFFILDQARKLGTSCFRLPIPLGTGGLHIIGDPAVTRAIFMDATTTKPRRIYKTFEGGVSMKSLFTSSTDSYAKSIRKSVAHAFSKKEIERMNSVAVKHIKEWMKGRLQHFVDTEEAFDPCYEMTRLTFFIINEAAFEYEVTEEECEEFTDQMETALREFALKQGTAPWRKWFGAFIPDVRKARECSRKCHVFTRKVLEAYKANPAKSEQTTIIKLFSNADCFSSEKQRDSETMSWIVAGQDTTGFTLGNALTLFAKHPAEQKKVRDALLADKETPNARDIPVFRNALQECMRFIPVAALGSIREAGRDVPVENGKIIPKGAVCMLTQFVCNRNPDVFQDPDEFRPDRWENETKPMADSKMTFALGPRNCPGQYLATTEIHSLLPLILTQYSLELVDEGSFDYFLTLKYSGSKIRAKRLPGAP